MTLRMSLRDSFKTTGKAMKKALAASHVIDNFLPIPDAESLPFTAWHKT